MLIKRLFGENVAGYFAEKKVLETDRNEKLRKIAVSNAPLIQARLDTINYMSYDPISAVERSAPDRSIDGMIQEMQHSDPVFTKNQEQIDEVKTVFLQRKAELIERVLPDNGTTAERIVRFCEKAFI